LIHQINQALLELQGALLARALYPAEHPRIRASEKRTLELLTELLKSREKITLFAVPGKVIFEGEALPSGAALVDTLFRMLKIRGVDQITFRRGVDRDEIVGLLDRLVATNSENETTISASEHVRFSALQADTFSREQRPLPKMTSAIEFAEQAADVLPGIWLGLYNNYIPNGADGPRPEVQPIDPSQLGDIVSCVSRVVRDSSTAMLPLAPLKRHDEYTFVHTINVAILSTSLAEALGLDANTAHELNIAALLHDVGKQIVPQEVLSKPGRFNEEERILMEQHPVEGARMLLATAGVPELAPIVAYEHHVRADGSGYPRLPRGWRLSLASRIVQLADVFDALRTHRPYRPGIPVPKIVEMMRNDAGTFFDTDLLKVFFEEVVSRGLPGDANPAAGSPVPAAQES